MTRAAKKAKERYDAAWSESTTGFDNYCRNMLLKNWTSKWDGHGKKMLDVGCGNGLLCEYFAGLGYEVTGIDISEVGIAEALERVEGNFKVANAEEPLPFENASFDLVFWGDNAEHLIDPMSVLGEIKRVLRSDGRLIISCPNIGYWWFRIFFMIKGHPPRNEGHINPPWQWEHIRFYNPRILLEFLRIGGFDIVRLEGTNESWIGSIMARYLPGLFATILLAEAKHCEDVRK